MKTYTGIRGYLEHEIGAGPGYRGEAFVKVDGRPLPLRLDLANHSPTGFEWGYGGSGPAQLALALLADALGDDYEAQGWYQHFKAAVIVALEHDSWTLTDQSIRETVACLRFDDREHTERLDSGRPHWLYVRHVKGCDVCKAAENGEAPDWCPEGKTLFETSERALGDRP